MMQHIEDILGKSVIKATKSIYGQDLDARLLQFQKTRREFEGDITLVVFPLLKISGKSPDITANELGNYLHQDVPEVTRYNVVKGFLNLVISDGYYMEYLGLAKDRDLREDAGNPARDATIMVEFSSPNTNKPLHLGHVRNNLLGVAVSRILAAGGNHFNRHWAELCTGHPSADG